MLFLSFLPILLFIFFYVGSGLYFSFLGVANAFYQISPWCAILPAIGSAFIINYFRGCQSSVEDFLKGAAHSDIIGMCFIFIFAGAFSEVTKSIRCIDAIVNFSLCFFPGKFLLIGLFFAAGLISTAIGSSMGTIAAISPIAIALAGRGVFGLPLAMGTIVGGAMFGDNLSLISDTTIAAISATDAEPKKKFFINLKVGLMASILTICYLLFQHAEIISEIAFCNYSLILLIPYVVLLFLSLKGFSVFINLLISIFVAYGIGYITSGYTLFSFNRDLVLGINGMIDILVLSLFVGGLSGLLSYAIVDVNNRLSLFAKGSVHTKRFGKFLIAGIVSFFDILFANNTIAIIFAGNLTKNFINIYKINKNEVAFILDAASCVFQGLIPWGAQLLLASSMAGLSPFDIMPYVFYCYALALITFLYMIFYNEDEN
jgi:Na+/H+ antiporter NhaC